MLSAKILDEMVAAGCTRDQIVALMKAALAADDERRAALRANNAERQRRHREARKSRAVTRDDRNAPSPPYTPSSLPPAPNPTPPISPSFHKPEQIPEREHAALDAFVSMAQRAALPMPQRINRVRLDRLGAILDQHGLGVWREVVERIGASSFCRGQNKRGWKADLDFLLKQETILKALEGRYDDGSPTNHRGPQPKYQTASDFLMQLAEHVGGRDGPIS